MTTWTKKDSSERATVGNLECDVWPSGGGARYSVLDTETGRYLAGGKCADLGWAKEVSSNFARSVLAVVIEAK